MPLTINLGAEPSHVLTVEREAPGQPDTQLVIRQPFSGPRDQASGSPALAVLAFDGPSGGQTAERMAYAMANIARGLGCESELGEHQHLMHTQVAHALGMSPKESWAVLGRVLKERLQAKPSAPSTVPRVLIAERSLQEVGDVLADVVEHTDESGRPLSVVELARRRMADLREVALRAEKAVEERDSALQKAETWQQTAAAMETRALQAEAELARRPQVAAPTMKPATATQTIRAWSTDPVQRVPPPLAEPPAQRFTLLDGNFLGDRWCGHEVLMDARTGKPVAVGNHRALSSEREALGGSTPIHLLSLQGLLGLLNELTTKEGK